MNERIDVGRRFPVGSLVCGLLGITLVGLLAFAGEPPGTVVLAGGMPLSLALVLLLARAPGINLELTDTTVVNLGTSEEIPYSSIQAVTVGSRSPRPGAPLAKGAILVVHERGVFEIPSSPPGFEGLYARLTQHFSSSGSTRVTGRLESYLQRQQENFDMDLIWTFCASSSSRRTIPRRATRAVLSLFLCTGIAFVLLGMLGEDWFEEPQAFIGIGGMLILVSLPLMLLAWASSRTSRQPFKGWEQSSIVIGPAGIGLHQGDLTGELTWEEITSVTLGRSSQSFQLTSSRNAIRGLRLDVTGASFIVADIYDRPLWVLEDVIHRYWRQQT